jgi:Ca2+-binding RTX toxin-like protein
MRRGVASRSTVTVVLSSAVVLYGLPAFDAAASSPGTPQAIAAAHGVGTLAVALDALADHPAMSTKLPLTDRSPADILGFPTLFTRTLAAPMGAFDGDYADLADAIENASTTGITYTVPGGVTENGDVATFTIHVAAHSSQDVPISYVRPGGAPDEPNPRPAIVVHGTDTAGNGTVSVGMTLTADLPLTMDKGVLAADGTTIDLPNALSLDPANASLSLATDDGSSEDALSFTARYGFTDVTVEGRAAYDITGATTFTDPDANGAVTQDEWAHTLLPDWAAFALTDTSGGNDVDVALTFDSSLLASGAHGGTITYLDSGAPSYVDLRPLNATAPAPTAPTVALTALEPFTRVGADDALTGLSQFSAAMAAAQARIDHKLPLLDKKFSDAFDPANELQELVEHQGSAAIVCGKADTQPPTGADLAGTTWYCQAVTKQDVTNVHWHRADGTTTGITGATTATTVGQSPTTNITVAGITGEPDVAVSFDVTAEQADGTTTTETFTAEPRIRSAQELQTALDDLDGSTITVGYDATAETLTYDVTIAGDPAALDANYDVGDALRQRTGLSALTSTGTVSLDVGNVTLAGAYGLLLQDDLAVLDSDSLDGQVDRYFAKLGTGREVAVDTVTVTGGTDSFTGKVGYLGVDATATSWAITPTATGDVLAADLALDAAHAVTGHDGVTIANAVSLRRLLALADPVVPTFNLSFDAAFDVAANGNLSSLTDGNDQATVTAEWHDFGPTTQPVASGNEAYDTYLRPFDVLPLVEGKATNATKSTITLSDSESDFLSAFGHTLAAGDKLPATLMNGSTGATCEDATVTDAHTITCDAVSVVDDGTTDGATLAGMAGGRRLSTRTGTAADGTPTYANADGTPVTAAVTDDNDWRAGDTWRVTGDQDALRALLLENLFDIANRLDQNTEPGYVTPLPMLGLTPKELTPQFGALRDVATAIGERVPVTAQAPSWVAAHAYALNDLALPTTPVTGIPLLYKATTAGTSGAAQPAWPSTVGGTVADGTVTWTAVSPAAVPPATLQDLKSALSAEMTARTTAGGVALSSPTVNVTLDDIAHTLPNGTTLSGEPHAQLAITWAGADTVDAPVRMDLTPLSGLDLHGIAREDGTVGALSVPTTSSAKVRFAVPLSPDIPAGDVIVRADTGVTSLTASVDSSTVDFTASVGSLGLALGTSARLFGRHDPVTGTHTADPVASGTFTNYTLSGTAGAGSTGSSLTDPATDFVAKGVATGATVTSGANTCTVTGIAQHTLTCALNNSATWASGNAYSLSQPGNAKTATASGLAAPGFTALIAGDVIRQGNANCTVTASTVKTQTTVDCTISSGTWDATKTFVVERASVLTDGDRTGDEEDPDDTRAFTTFLSAGGTGTSVTDITDANASCAVGTITGTTVSCTTGTALSGGAAWTKDDVYRLDLGDTTKVLVDPGTGFDGMGLVGRTVFNRTDNASCVVTSTTKDSVTCASALTNSGRWDAGDYYEIQGPGVMKADLAQWSLLGAVDEDPETYTGDANLAVSMSGALVQPSCGDSATGTATVGDACAVLAAQLVDPSAPRGTATAVAGDVVTTTVPAALTNGTKIRNDSAAFNCVVTQKTTTSFTCKAPSGKSWHVGDAWHVDDGTFVGVLTFTASFGSGTSTAAGLGTAFTDAAAGEEPLEFSLLSVAMDLLRGYVEDGLDGTLAAEPFPLIGLDRTAGAHVLDGLQALEDELASNPSPAFKPGPNSMAQFKADIETYLSGAIDNAGSSLLKVLSTKNAGNHNTGVTVTLLCKTTPNAATSHACADGTDTDENIYDVRVRTTIGGDAAAAPQITKGCGNCDTNVASVHLERFDSGLPGLQIDGPNGLEAEVGWTYDVDFGLARDVGPYIGTNTADPTDKALEIGADVHLPDSGVCAAPLPAGAAAGQTHEEGDANDGYSATRCFQATLGMLQGIVYDGVGDATDSTDGVNADRTGLTFKATVDLAPAAAGDAAGRISLDSLTSPDVAIPEFRANATGNIDLYFVTGVTTGGSPAGTTLPSVQGTVHVGFAVNGALSDTEAEATAFGDIGYADLQMDAGSFVNEFMQPIVAELYALTRPFKTIADILMAPIPVLKEIAALTGQKLGTLLDLLEQAAAKPLALVRSVVGIVQLVADLAAKAASTLVGLGSWNNGVQEKGGFKVGKKNASSGTCGKTGDDGKKTPKDCKKAFKQDGTNYKQSVVQLKACPANGCTGKELARTMTRGKSIQKFDGMGITFPFLNDTSQVMGLLVGEQATLVRFDPGAFGVSASLSYSWGPFMAGPVPVDITIGGTIGLSAHFAVGYDTRGIMNVLKQDRDSFDASALADGIFIDDLDVNGNDVDEIELTFVVTLGASVSISIFKVGLYGGVGITIGFDLVDPDHDGKLYIDEIEQFKDNPLCLFKVQGLLDFFFGFFVEIDLVLWSKRWDVELFRLKPPIKLFEVECQRFEPDLAIHEGSNLRLNIGDGTAGNGHTYAFNRHYKSTRTQEKFVVHQLEAVVAGQPTKVQVEFSGLVQDDTVPAGGRIVADAGSGNDVVELAAGADDDGVAIPFTVGATVDGGAGDDKLTTGDGNDTVTGGADADKIGSGAGDDTVSGGGGTDNLDGGLGDDVLNGGAGDDRVNGNAGADWVGGDGDNDTLNGGPGLNAAQAATARSRNAALTVAGSQQLLDGRDVVVGGTGSDTLSGHFAGDYLFGGGFAGLTGTFTDRERLADLTGATTFSFDTACAATTSSDAGDQLQGEAGNDVLVGDEGDDQLAGGPDDDKLCGGTGNDFVEGDNANSSVPGNDTLRGNAGADQLVARGGTDVLDGGTGDDLVDAGAGDDRATGGTGADAIDAGDGSDIVLGDTGTIPASAPITTAGSDVKSLVTSDTGSDAVSGTVPIVCRASANVLADGKLDLDGNGAADSGRFLGRLVTAGVVMNDAGGTFNGTLGERVVTNGLVQGGMSSMAGIGMAVAATNGASSDCILAGTGHDAVFAGRGDDTVVGDAGRDYVAGDSGNDFLRGYQDADEIDGGAGLDDVYGDTGDDLLTGGAGNDAVHGGIGDDTAFGGPGNDAVSGEDGADTLVGGSATAATADGDDTIDGGADNDVIAGDNATPVTGGVTLLDLSGGFAGNDVLGGQTGDDSIFGGGGNDTINGNEQNDRLDGNGGDDTINGNGGNDRLVGGTAQSGVPDGADALHGGQGTDTLLGDNGIASSLTFYDGDAGNDQLWGDEADDLLFGQGGADTLHGNAGADRLVGGGGTAGQGDGGDTIHGDDGADVIAGDNASITAAFVVTLHDQSGGFAGGDTINGNVGADRIYGQGGGDTIHGNEDGDAIEGNSGADTIYGDAGNDRIAGGSGVADQADDGDTISGGTGTDSIAGDNATITAAGAVTPLDLKTGNAIVGAEAGADTITGDADDDVIYGTGAGDSIHGNGGNDYVEGGSGADTIFGDDGTDRIMGGSSTADVRDDGDTISGGEAADVLTGDNAVFGSVTLLDVLTSGQSPGSNAGGDTIHGDAANDVVYGQTGNDTLYGDGGDDYLEGNAGDDTVNGGTGADRITGGSGVDNGGSGGALRELRNTLDGADTIHGDEDADVMTGDNARIDAGGTVTLYDEDVSGTAGPPADVSGGDTMYGDGGTDRMYGQGGGDTMRGNDAADVMEGNTGADTMTGDDGDDTMAGGTMRDGAIRDGAVSGAGDTMSGGAGVDVMLGDNGVVAGSGATARWTFFDLDPAGAGPHPNADLSGPDAMNGDAGTDWMFGQGGDDTMSGGSEDDRVQGNSGADGITGDAGADDVVGGSAVHYVGTTLTSLPNRTDGADTIAGNDGADVVVADNGRIDRTGATDLNTGAAVRTVRLFDVAIAGAAAPPANASGADTVTGDDGRDLLFGGGADDVLHGNAGDDVVEGNAGADTVTGDAGDDDLLGGGSSLADGIVRFAAPAATAAATVTNLADGNDTIDGGTGEDAVLGDNGVVARTLTALGAWTYHAAPFAEIPKRTVQAPIAHELAGAFGNDTVTGGAGHDELLGELGNDTVSGDAGDDAMLGDLGRFTYSVNGTGTGQNGKVQTVLSDSAKFLSETVFATGSLQRDDTLYDIPTGGNDVLDGGTGNDALHGGAGNDTLSGNAGATDLDVNLTAVCATAIALTCDRDVIFGDDGDDTMWGGPDKDHMYGGYGSDHLDVVRPGTANPRSKFMGPDVMYGGWQQDAMQGDLSSPSPNALDKLIDSTGVYNIYYVCEGAYGGASVVRSPSPSMQSTLQSLATADGAFSVPTKGSSGFDELSMVFTNEFSQNSNPAFLDSPGHFTCG